MTRRGLGLLVALGCALAVPRPAAARPDDDRRLPAIVVDAEDRAVVVVAVELPEELREVRLVRWSARVRGGATIIGRSEGMIAEAIDAPRRFLLTLRLPPDPHAGIAELAEITFRGGETPVVLPISVRVELRRQLIVSGPSLLADLHPGDRLELPYRIRNLGNAPETLLVRVQGPAKWTVRPQLPQRLVVERRQEAEFVATVAIPMSAGVGDEVLRVDVLDGPLVGAPALAGARTTLRVAPAIASNGLLLRPVVAAAAGSGGSAAFVGASLEGAVTEEVRLTARYNPRVRRTGIVNQGLSSVGAIGTPFSATLSARDWSVTAGNGLTELSELAGVNLMGEGITASGRRGEYEARAMVARPTAGFGASGQLLGGGLWRDTEFGRVGGAVSHLVERGGIVRGRELTAVSAEYESMPLGTWRLGSGLAYRSSATTAGVGYTMRALHERDRDRLELRVGHAPGGSAAFARATDDWQLQAARVVSDRWSVDAALNRSTDAGNVFRRLRTDNASLGQRVALTDAIAVTLRGQVSRFDAISADTVFGGFGAGTREVTGGVDWRRGPLSLSVDGSLGAVSRRTELLGGRTVETVAGQQGFRLYAARGLERLGVVDASIGGQFTGVGIGFPSEVWIGSARWSALPLTLAGRSVRFDHEVQYQRLGGLQSFVVLRSSLSTALPGNLELAMSAERNPFFRDAAGRAGWIAAMRVSAATALFAPAARGPEGVAFVDRNRNGTRDAGEPGVAGVVVQRGDARATTDRLGHYRLPARVRGRTRVQQSSLPAGLLAHPRTVGDSLDRLEVPLLVTGSVRLELRMVPDEEGRVPAVRMRDVRVTLQDETGFQWVGRRLDDSTLAFEDIPAGSYAPRFDLSLLPEPLRVEEATTVTVAERARGRVVVPLRGRNVRIIIPRSRNGTRTGTATGPVQAAPPR